MTEWIQAIKDCGDGVAQQGILERYWNRLAGLARVKLRTSRKRVFDEEDVVVKTLNSFFEAAESGKCPEMSNRDDLWNYLVRIAERKAIDMMRAEGADKRGGGNVVGEQTAFPAVATESKAGGFENIRDLGDPTAEMAEEFTSCCYEWLSLLNEEERLIVTLKGQGCSNREIAGTLEVVERSVERKLKAIRSKLSKLDE